MKPVLIYKYIYLCVYIHIYIYSKRRSVIASASLSAAEKKRIPFIDGLYTKSTRVHTHRNWSESGFGSLKEAPLDISRCLGEELTPQPYSYGACFCYTVPSKMYVFVSLRRDQAPRVNGLTLFQDAISEHELHIYTHNINAYIHIHIYI